MSYVSSELFADRISDKLALALNLDAAKKVIPSVWLSGPEAANHYRMFQNAVRVPRIQQQIANVESNLKTLLSKTSNPKAAEALRAKAAQKIEAIRATMPKNWALLNDTDIKALSAPNVAQPMPNVSEAFARHKLLVGDSTYTAKDFVDLVKRLRSVGSPSRNVLRLAGPAGNLPGAMPESMTAYINKLAQGL